MGTLLLHSSTSFASDCLASEPKIYSSGNDHYFESRAKVVYYETLFQDHFPKAKHFLYNKNLPVTDETRVEEVILGDYEGSYGNNYNRIYFVGNIFDNVVVLFDNPPSKLAALANVKNECEVHVTSQEELSIGDQEFKPPKDVQKSLVYKKKYPNLKEIIQWMNREFDHGYKHHITTTVVSRYLSDHFLNVCLYLKREGFQVNYLDYQPIVFEKIIDGAKLYIDPTKIKVLDGEFVHKNDNAPIAQGKVALSSHTGKITQTFQVGIRFPKTLRNDDDKTD